jgi:hypothetical protein
MLVAWRIISQDYQYPDDALLRPRAAMRSCHISDEAKIFSRAFRVECNSRGRSASSPIAARLHGSRVAIRSTSCDGLGSTPWFNNVAQQCLGHDIKKSLYLNAEPLSARAPRIIAGRVRAAVPPDRRHESWPLLPPKPVTM